MLSIVRVVKLHPQGRMAEGLATPPAAVDAVLAPGDPSRTLCSRHQGIASRELVARLFGGISTVKGATKIVDAHVVMGVRVPRAAGAWRRTGARRRSPRSPGAAPCRRRGATRRRPSPSIPPPGRPASWWNAGSREWAGSIDPSCAWPPVAGHVHLHGRDRRHPQCGEQVGASKGGEGARGQHPHPHEAAALAPKGYARCLRFRRRSDARRLGGHVHHQAVASNGQPWYRQRRPHSSLRPKAGGAAPVRAMFVENTSKGRPPWYRGRPRDPRPATTARGAAWPAVGLGHLPRRGRRSSQCPASTPPIGVSPSTRQSRSFSIGVGVATPRLLRRLIISPLIRS